MSTSIDVDSGAVGQVAVLPQDTPVSFYTDRLLAPSSVANAVELSSGALVLISDLTYDPARKRVTVAPRPGQMLAGVEYNLVITTTLLGWDGAPLSSPVERNFIAGVDVAPHGPMPDRPRLSADVVPILASHCALAGCHTPPEPVMALDLSSAAGVYNTCLAVLARERPSTGAGVPEHIDPQWGAMYRVDPGSEPNVGRPGYSYLVYKLLGDGPIIGSPMPPSGESGLTAEQIATVSDWIARGAPND